MIRFEPPLYGRYAYDKLWRLCFSRVITSLLQSSRDLVIRNRMQDTVWMSFLLYLKDPVYILIDILRCLDLQPPISP
jgi:hypothetical protein